MKSPHRLLLFGLGCATAFGVGVWVGHSRRPVEPVVARGTASTPAALPRADAVPRSAAATHLARDLSSAFDVASHAGRYIAVGDLIRGLTPDNWRAVQAAFEQERKTTGRLHAEEWVFFALRLGEVAGREGAEYFAANKDYDTLRKVLTGWAGKDPQAALNWIAHDADEETRRLVKGAVIRGLAATEPDLAISAIEGIPLATRRNYVNNFATTLVQAAGIAQSEALIDAMAKRAVIEGSGGDEYMRRVFGDFAAIKLEHAFRYGDGPAAAEWLTRQADQPYVDYGYVDHDVIAEAAQLYAAHDPIAALRWLQDLNAPSTARDPTRTFGFRELMAGWIEKDGLETVGQWLLANPDERNYDRLALNYAATVGAKDPAAAAAWAGALKNPVAKKQALEMLQRNTARKK